MKISIQIEGDEVVSVKSSQSAVPAEILEKAATLGAEDAGPAPASELAQAGPELAAFSGEMAINCGKAPKEFQTDAVPEMQISASAIELAEAKDAGKAVIQLNPRS